MSEPGKDRIVSLVSSDGGGRRGAGWRDRTPGQAETLRHVVLRASRVLCTDSFTARTYELRFRTTGEMGDLLRRIPVEYVILDHAAQRDLSSSEDPGEVDD